MNTICTCSLNGINPQLHSEALILNDVRELPPEIQRTVVNVAARNGSRLLRTRAEGLSVSLDFELHELNAAARLELCRYLAYWAAPGGWLTLSHRPGQRLWVTCDAPPTLTSALRWTEPITVTFTAWEAPWWESVNVTSATGTGRSGHVTIRPPGDQKTCLQWEITAQTTVTSLTVKTERESIHLRNFTLPPGETLLLDYDDLRLPRLTAQSRSYLAHRTPESAEDLMLLPGVDNTVTWEADGNVAVKFTARGRYL